MTTEEISKTFAKILQKDLQTVIRSTPMKSIKIDPAKFSTLAICAIRYCQGRQTYMPDLVRDIVRPFLKDISNSDLDVMIDDCRFQRKMDLYGDDVIDKPGWLKWEAELIEEKERRKHD